MIQIIKECQHCGAVELSRTSCPKFLEKPMLAANLSYDYHLGEHSKMWAVKIHHGNKMLCPECNKAFELLIKESEEKRTEQLSGFFQVQP